MGTCPSLAKAHAAIETVCERLAFVLAAGPLLMGAGNGSDTPPMLRDALVDGVTSSAVDIVRACCDAAVHVALLGDKHERDGGLSRERLVPLGNAVRHLSDGLGESLPPFVCAMLQHRSAEPSEPAPESEAEQWVTPPQQNATRREAAAVAAAAALSAPLAPAEFAARANLTGGWLRRPPSKRARTECRLRQQHRVDCDDCDDGQSQSDDDLEGVLFGDKRRDAHTCAFGLLSASH